MILCKVEVQMYANSVAVKVSFIAALIELGNLSRGDFFNVLADIEQSELDCEQMAELPATELSIRHLRIVMEKRWGVDTTNSLFARLEKVRCTNQLNIYTLNWFVLKAPISLVIQKSEVA